MKFRISLILLLVLVLSQSIAAEPVISLDKLSSFAARRVRSTNLDTDIASTEKHLKNNPYDDEAREKLGWLYLGKKNISKGGSCALAAVRIRPFHSRHLLQQAYVMLAEGKTSGVGRLLARAKQAESVPFNHFRRNDVPVLLGQIMDKNLHKAVEEEMNASLKTNTFRLGPTRASVVKNIVGEGKLKQTAYEPGNKFRIWVAVEDSFLRVYDWEKNKTEDHRKKAAAFGVAEAAAEGIAFTRNAVFTVSLNRFLKYDSEKDLWTEPSLPEDMGSLVPVSTADRDHDSVKVGFGEKGGEPAQTWVYTVSRNEWKYENVQLNYKEKLKDDFGARQFSLRRTGKEVPDTELQASAVLSQWYDLADYLDRMGHRVTPPEIISKEGVLYEKGLHVAALRHGAESTAVFPYAKGMTIPVWNADGLSGVKSTAVLNSVCKAGSGWISLTPTGYQNDPLSTSIEIDREWTASMPSLESAVIKAKAKGLRVLLKPHVNLSVEKQDNHMWRGLIRPGNTEAVKMWFAGYKAFLMPFIDLAIKAEVDMIAVGVELKGLHSYTAEWKDVIKAVRQRGYKGYLTYAALHETYDKINFWKDLDYIGIDAYFGATRTNKPSFTMLINGFRRLASRLEAFSNKQNKKIIFTEIGYNNLDGCNSRPWYWSGNTANLDNMEQAACYHAVFEIFPREQWFAGMFWWAWEPGDAPFPDTVSYSPQSKLAELILEAYYLEKKKK